MGNITSWVDGSWARIFPTGSFGLSWTLFDLYLYFPLVLTFFLLLPVLLWSICVVCLFSFLSLSGFHQMRFACVQLALPALSVLHSLLDSLPVQFCLCSVLFLQCFLSMFHPRFPVEFWVHLTTSLSIITCSWLHRPENHANPTILIACRMTLAASIRPCSSPKCWSREMMWTVCHGGVSDILTLIKLGILEWSF